MLGVLNSVSANAALDENVTISFTALSNQITWQLTGIDVNTAGVSGTLGPFNNACAILQGHPKTTGNVMTRRVFVLDGGDASSAAALYVYERTDTISAASGQTNDAVTVTLTHTVPLALSGAANPICYMAGNDDLIIAGTSANVSAALIYKAGLAVETISQPLLSYGDTVSAVTASDNGFVFVTWALGLIRVGPNIRRTLTGFPPARISTSPSWRAPRTRSRFDAISVCHNVHMRVWRACALQLCDAQLSGK